MEVVRRGRFSWDVVTRGEGLLLDMSLEQPRMFRWTAVRIAKRIQREKLRQRDEQIVLRLPLDGEPR